MATNDALIAAVPHTAILTVWSSWRLSPHGFLISTVTLFSVCRQCAGRRYKPQHLRAFCKRQNAFHPEAGQSWPITSLLSNCIMLKKRWNPCSWHKMLGRLWMTRKISSPGLNILDPSNIAFFPLKPLLVLTITLVHELVAALMMMMISGS